MQRSPEAYGLTSQQRSVLSIAFESRKSASGETRSPVTMSWWPSSTIDGSPGRRTSYTRIRPSRQPVYTVSPSCAMLTAVTGNGWPSTRAHVRTRASHSRALPSSEPLASTKPSRAGHTVLTKPWCPLNWRTRPPVAVSHSATVLSADAVNACSPSLDQWSSSTAFWWPFNVSVFLHSPKTSHSSTSLSCEPESRCLPSGLNFVVSTWPVWPVSSMIGLSRSDVRAGPETASAPPPLAPAPLATSSVRGRFASTSWPPTASSPRFAMGICAAPRRCTTTSSVRAAPRSRC